MKNKLRTFVIVAIAACTMIGNANAQTALHQSISDKVDASTSIIDNDQKNNDASSTINVRALKNFKRTFKGVNATWVATEDKGFIARFTTDGVQTVTAYNFKGIRQYTIRFYSESKMPGDIIDMVKYNYCGYSISTIAEVYYEGETIYVIYLQDDTHLKIITVCNGEMQEARGYNRG